MRNVIRPFRTAFLRITESSAGFCFLLSFIPRPRLLQKTLSEITYRSSCVRLEAGNPRRPPLPSAFAGFSCAPVCNSGPRICRYWMLSEVLLGSLSCGCSELIEVFDRRIWGIIPGELSVSIQPWTSFALISVRCDLHWQSETFPSETLMTTVCDAIHANIERLPIGIRH